MVGTVLMVGVVAVAMTFIAYVVLSGRPAPELFVSFKVTVENTADAREVKLTITHAGGDIVPNPANYLGVGGRLENVLGTDNKAYEKLGENGFSNYGEFKLGDSAVLFIRHDDVIYPGDAIVKAGYYYRVWIYDNYSEKVQYDGVLQVKLGYG